MKISTKTLSKIFTFVLAVIMITNICGNVIAVTDPGKLSLQDDSSFNTVGGKVVGAVQGIGSVVAVLILVVLGIKYMMGSAEEKAEYKKTMIPYLVGAILIFAASAIAGAIYKFGQLSGGK